MDLDLHIFEPRQKQVTPAMDTNEINRMRSEQQKRTIPSWDIENGVHETKKGGGAGLASFRRHFSCLYEAARWKTKLCERCDKSQLLR